MKNRTIILACILFGVIVVGMFVYAYLKRVENVNVVPEPVEYEDVPYSNIDRVDATHFFVNGTHTIVGEFLLPTPCDLLDSSVTVAESFPEQIMINFSVINNAEACAQVLTTARFKVEATASADATFSASFMDRPIILNLIEAAPGTSPDDFDIYQKG